MQICLCTYNAADWYLNFGKNIYTNSGEYVYTIVPVRRLYISADETLIYFALVSSTVLFWLRNIDIILKVYLVKTSL